jgi:predicted lipase
MKTDEIKLLIDAKLKEKRASISDFDAQISALETQLIDAITQQSEFKKGDVVLVKQWDKVVEGIFDSYRVNRYSEIEAIVFVIKKDGTASKNTMWTSGAKIEKA